MTIEAQVRSHAGYESNSKPFLSAMALEALRQKADGGRNLENMSRFRSGFARSTEYFQDLTFESDGYPDDFRNIIVG